MESVSFCLNNREIGDKFADKLPFLCEVYCEITSGGLKILSMNQEEIAE